MSAMWMVLLSNSVIADLGSGQRVASRCCYVIVRNVVATATVVEPRTTGYY